MEKNIGNTDRIVRLILGLVILGSGVYYGSWLGVLGLVPLYTTISGWCPLYSLLGISTRGKKEKET
jgi:hypothetical protein